MPHLAIDINRTSELGDQLGAMRRRIESVHALIIEAETLAEVDSRVTGPLDEIELTFAAIAAAIASAADRATGFAIGDQLARADFGPWSPVEAPRWDAEPATPWNRVHQQASHNSYAVEGGIEELYRRGVRSFELDIHRGAPTDFSALVNGGPWPLAPLLALLDANSHAGSTSGDWLVYHHSADLGSEYALLSDGLRAIALLGNVGPLTLFIDNKDRFGGRHTPQALDRLLEAELGDKLFTPGDLLARSPGAQTLLEAVETAGWPTSEELSGQVIVVLTDNVDGYEPDAATAFVAVSPRFVDGDNGDPFHVAEPGVVFYNAHSDRVNPAEISALHEGTLLRTYGVDPCDTGPTPVGPNYVAVDHDFPESCPRSLNPRADAAPRPDL